MDIEKLPFGNLLLDKADINYEQKMKILNQTQEILDDFKLDSSKILELDNKLAIFYDGEEGIAASVLGFEKQASQEFEVFLFEISSINRVNGYLGNFQAELENGEFGTGIYLDGCTKADAEYISGKYDNIKEIKKEGE